MVNKTDTSESKSLDISRLFSKRIADQPVVPAGYYAISTMVFEDQSAIDLALSEVGTALRDIPNFTNTEPVMLIGEIIS